MKEKTISKILTGKLLAWTRSIEDEAVRKLAEANAICTGGAIVSMLQNEEINDFDIYLRTPEAAFAIAQYYVKKLKENPPATFKGDAKHTVEVTALLEPAIAAGAKGHRIGGDVSGPQDARVRIVVKSAGIASATAKQTDYQYFEGVQDPNAQAAATDQYVSDAMGGDEYAEGQIGDTSEPIEPSSYQGNVEALDDEPAVKVTAPSADEKKHGKYRVMFVTSNAITLSDQIQIVLRFQGEPDQIHVNYDFTHCTSFFTLWDKKLTLRPEALICIMTKELRYQGSKFPICSIIRTRKFITRGWTINAGQFVKMAYQVAQLDMNDANVLEDQLVGVDSAYFSQLITQLRDQPDPTRVDGGYLMTLVDKIFG